MNTSIILLVILVIFLAITLLIYYLKYIDCKKENEHLFIVLNESRNELIFHKNERKFYECAFLKIINLNNTLNAEDLVKDVLFIINTTNSNIDELLQNKLGAKKQDFTEEIHKNQKS